VPARAGESKFFGYFIKCFFEQVDLQRTCHLVVLDQCRFAVRLDLKQELFSAMLHTDDLIISLQSFGSEGHDTALGQLAVNNGTVEGGYF